MQLLTGTAQSAVMDAQRGDEIQRRLDALGISDREFHERTGIDRKTLRRAIAGEERVRSSTYGAIEAALDRLERDVTAGTEGAPGGLVTFRLSGNFGVDVVVQGPVTNLSELEASVERLVQSMKKDDPPEKG